MPQNLWNDAEYRALPDLDGLVYRSNILGRDRAVVNIYGGNTSAKLVQTDFLGRPTRVLYVKASGSDVLTIKASQFAALRLDDIDPLFQRAAMSDEEMIDYLSFTAFEPGRPRQSIETLLHAFVPAKHVDHTHPDTVISLACTPAGEATARKLYGKRMAWVEYIRPGFTLSQWIGQRVLDNPKIECVVMGKHGLVTWGDDSKACYDQTIRIIQEAEDYIADQRKGKAVFGPVRTPAMPKEERIKLLEDTLPLVRGLVSEERGAILAYDDSEAVLDYVSRERTGPVSQSGAACPDHLVHVKRQPLFVDWQSADGFEALKARLTSGIAEYKTRYVEYFNANQSEGDELRDAAPRVILIPGLGMITTGKDATDADVSQQLYHRAIDVIGGSEALGGFESLTAAEAYGIEYWPLELYKLKLKPPDRDLAGKVVFITGAASGIGRATAYRMAQEGAHVVIADINETGAQTVAADLVKRFGLKRGLAVACNVTSESAVQAAFREAALTYGGIDIVINNAGIAGGKPIEDTTLADWQRNIDILATGYFLVAREGFRILKKQGRGGVLIFVCSKNSIGAGKGAAAYSAAKAAELHLARCLAEEGGEYHIRVNSVLPDGVIQGSSIWDSEWREARAKNYGIKPDELEEFYRKRNTLKVNVTPDDLAEAILFLSGPRSAKTTGGVLTVDGGNPTAYVR
ncbi:MAG: bifunctional aldolase/short-chain dehydrogenase [Aggregatilineales bacterium]